ncbi:MAG: prepilin-type N-terminal cleavage/methylation domain-containing protein [Deltaproteobacteria bacterium]|nr:prepilin-type N-terminal cleavage/methylation domain-containing protein [Deltaproteobacteria bacterium]
MNKIANSSGFTLIEIMIAMFVLAVGLLGAAGVATTVINGNAFSNKITTATTLAQDKMEEISNLGYSGTPSSDTTTTEDYNSITSYPTYKRVTGVVVNSPAAGMKTIEVVVAFPWKGSPHNATLKTIVAE